MGKWVLAFFVLLLAVVFGGQAIYNSLNRPTPRAYADIPEGWQEITPPAVPGRYPDAETDAEFGVEPPEILEVGERFAVYSADGREMGHILVVKAMELPATDVDGKCVAVLVEVRALEQDPRLTGLGSMVLNWSLIDETSYRYDSPQTFCSADIAFNGTFRPMESIPPGFEWGTHEWLVFEVFPESRELWLTASGRVGAIAAVRIQ